uniref:Uncharacterized protein n=1 Tax=Anopheles culicifacies TaxID=139723 RepID=A0A182MQQ7_9DIPT
MDVREKYIPTSLSNERSERHLSVVCSCCSALSCGLYATASTGRITCSENPYTGPDENSQPSNTFPSATASRCISHDHEPRFLPSIVRLETDVRMAGVKRLTVQNFSDKIVSWGI